MAFTQARDTNIGIRLTAAYIKVEDTSGNTEQINITVLVYYDDEARLNGKQPIEQLVYSFIPSVENGAPNYHKQGYEYLKTLPEFTGVIDV